MKCLDRIRVTDSVKLVYAKTTLKNHCKHINAADLSFLEYALMELGVNLYKHTGGGEIWFLEIEGELALAALDHGQGIADPGWAMERGNSSVKNSLGLGLATLNDHPAYRFELFTLTKPHLHGTIALLKPKRSDQTLHYLSLPYSMAGSGDFLAQKGKLMLFGDVAGHGSKAQQWATEIANFFYNHTISCITVDDFFQRLHHFLHQHHGRGVVLSLIQQNRKMWQLCGVGNVTVFYQTDEGCTMHHFCEGVIGTMPRKASLMDFDRIKGRLILTTDGIETRGALELFGLFDLQTDADLAALSLCWFAGTHDDQSVLILI